MKEKIKTGIILMNLGSPDSPSVKDVRKYLMQFLMDGRVIDYPVLSRGLLVGGIIVPFRAPKSSLAYQMIWTEEGSPLIVLTEKLKKALEERIEEPVSIAMRYGNPSMKHAYEELLAKMPDMEEVLAIPLYPHYAMSSYETAVEHAKTVHRKNKYSFSLKFIKPFYKDEDYLVALTESIRPYLKESYDHILFSYHGIPEGHVHKTDITGSHCLKVEGCCELPSPAHARCYRHQCFTTTALVAGRLGIEPGKFSVSFQSRLGRAEWLKPYTAGRLTELPSKGIKKLLIVCPAFISDCLETLEEIAVEGKHLFIGAGGESFQLIPCLNIHPLWVEALSSWIHDFEAGSTGMLLK